VKHIGIDPIENEPWGLTEFYVREGARCGLTDEDNLISASKDRSGDPAIHQSHQTVQERISVGHGGDMLCDYNRLSRPTREQKYRDIGRIERVVQQHDFGLSDFSPNSVDRSKAWDGKRYSKRMFSPIECSDRNRTVTDPWIRRSGSRVARKPSDALAGTAKLASELTDYDFDPSAVAIKVCRDYEDSHGPLVLHGLDA
jgi:hypothetical protein